MNCMQIFSQGWDYSPTKGAAQMDWVDSITPVLQYSQAFMFLNIRKPKDYFFIGYVSEWGVLS